jgi:phosphatidylinositol-3,4,5-trisphosphate 3-phosphatase/dual-specificity protein phosphatase PTEN
MRYVHYYEASLHRRVTPATYRLRHLRMHTVPNFDVGGGCDPYFYVLLGDGKRLVFNWKEAACGGKPPHYMPKHQLVDFDLAPFNVRVAGDVKIIFFDYDHFSAPDKMYHLWFNTGFVADNYLLFHKDVLDRASKDKDCREFAADFKLEIFLDRVDDVAGEFAGADGGPSIDDNDNDLDKDEADEE